MLKTGTKAPDFKLQNQSGEEVALSDFLGKKKVVLYFYPKDQTPGCTAEACSFRDHYEEFTDAGAEVIGVSGDSVQSHARFVSKKHLPFILLSDPGKKIHELYDVSKGFLGLISDRVTYVIDEEGTIRYGFKSQSQATKHVDESLKIINDL